VSGKCDPGCGLSEFPKGHPQTTEADMQNMMWLLYGYGVGYHAIADLCGRSHEELRVLLAQGFPGTRPAAMTAR